MSENIFKPSIFNPLAEYFEELTENENTNFKVFTDAKYDIDEMFQKDEVNNLYVEFGNDLLNKDLEELVSIKQAILMGMIMSLNPPWLRLLKKGRSDFFAEIKEYEHGTQIMQIFNESKLINNDLNAMYWWAYMESYFKNDNWNKRKIGIDGEYMSYNFEVNVLNTLKINKKPELTSVDNTNAGYDLISYRKDGSGNIFKIFIESKFNSQNQEAFYISRNEANKAVELNQNYYIYLWTDKNQDEPHVINTDDLEKNLPIDQGGSTWKEAFVKFK